MELNPAFRDYEERTNKVDKALRELRNEQSLIALKGWRDEASSFIYVIFENIFVVEVKP